MNPSAAFWNSCSGARRSRALSAAMTKSSRPCACSPLASRSFQLAPFRAPSARARMSSSPIWFWGARSIGRRPSSIIGRMPCWMASLASAKEKVPTSAG